MYQQYSYMKWQWQSHGEKNEDKTQTQEKINPLRHRQQTQNTDTDSENKVRDLTENVETNTTHRRQDFLSFFPRHVFSSIHRLVSPAPECLFVWIHRHCGRFCHCFTAFIPLLQFPKIQLFLQIIMNIGRRFSRLYWNQRHVHVTVNIITRNQGQYASSQFKILCTNTPCRKFRKLWLVFNFCFRVLRENILSWVEQIFWLNFLQYKMLVDNHCKTLNQKLTTSQISGVAFSYAPVFQCT